MPSPSDLHHSNLVFSFGWDHNAAITPRERERERERERAKEREREPKRERNK